VRARKVSEQLAVEARDRVVGPNARRLKAELRSSAIEIEIGHLNLDLSGLRNEQAFWIDSGMEGIPPLFRGLGISVKDSLLSIQSTTPKMRGKKQLN